MKKLFGLLIVLTLTIGGNCQEFSFIQPVGIEIFNNPGFSSSYSNWVKSSFRISNQGLASEMTQHTTGYWHRIKPINSNVGVAYTKLKETASGYDMSRVDLNYAYNLRINRKLTIVPAISGALVNVTLNVRYLRY